MFLAIELRLSRGWIVELVNDGTRALSAIEVASQGASPLKGAWGKQVSALWMTESALAARLKLRDRAQAP